MFDWETKSIWKKQKKMVDSEIITRHNCFPDQEKKQSLQLHLPGFIVSTGFVWKTGKSGGRHDDDSSGVVSLHCKKKLEITNKTFSKKVRLVIKV